MTKKGKDSTIQLEAVPNALPDNLIRKERGLPRLFNVIPGLNREGRRTLVAKIGKFYGLGQRHPKQQETERLLEFYANSRAQRRLFWDITGNLHKGTERPSILKWSAPLQLLQEAADWLGKPKRPTGQPDADFSEWPEIRERLSTIVASGGKELNPLGLAYLSLWPTLRSRLRDWSALDQAGREILTNATYSLSVVAGEAFFLNYALRHCPAFADGVSALLSAAKGAESEPLRLKRQKPPDANSTSGDEADMRSIDAIDADWREHLAALVSLAGSQPVSKLTPEIRSAFCDHATALVRLVDETRRCESVAAAAPKRDAAENLIRSLERLVGDPAFDTISAEFVAETARQWARQESAAGETVAEAVSIAEDALAVLEAEVRRAWDELTSRRAEFGKAEKAAAHAHGQSAQDRLKVVTLKRRLAEAEEAHLSAQDKLTTAVKPRAGGSASPTDTDSEARPIDSDDRVDDERIDASTVGEPRSETAPFAIFAPVTLERGATAQTRAGKEITEPASRSVPDESQRDDRSPSATEDAVWAAISRGDAATAWQLTSLTVAAGDEVDFRVPPAPVLEVAALSAAARTPSGPVAERLQRLIADVAELDSTLHPDTRDATNLILASSLLRAVLLAPHCGAYSYEFHLPAGVETLYDLLHKLRSYADRLRNHTVDASALAVAKTDADWQHRVASLKQEAADWFEAAPNRTLKYQGATEVWRYLLRSGRAVYQLLDPVRRGDITATRQVRSSCELLEKNSEGLINEIDRKELNRRKGMDIHGQARSQLDQRIGEAVSLARRWLSLVESRPEEGGFLHRTISELTADVGRLSTLARIELHEVAGRAEAGRLVEASQFARATLESFERLFDEVSESVDPAMTTPAEILGRPLLRHPEIRVSLQWQCLTAPAIARNKLILAQLAPPEWLQNLGSRIERGDLIGAHHVAALLDAGEAEDAVQARVVFDAAAERHWKALRGKIQQLQEQVERALAFGLIGEAARNDASATVTAFETALGDIGQIEDIERGLKVVADDLDRTKRERVAELQSRLTAISGIAAAEDIAFVERVLTSGDLQSATEYLNRIETGEALNDPATEIRDPFVEFFPTTATALTQYLTDRQQKEIIDSVKKGQSFAGLSFKGVTGAHMDRAVLMLESWFELKRSRPDTPAALERALRHASRILSELGFLGVGDLTAEGRTHTDFDGSFQTDVLEDREICPVPMFGSAAEGRYRLVCLWDRPTVDTILAKVGGSVRARPAIVFYMGRLSEAQRREFAEESRRKRHSCLVLDETLLMFLAAERRSRLAAFFTCAMPFTWSEPYVTTASIVPPELFFGRKEELRSVIDPSGGCFVYGGRQLGKTALLRHAARIFTRSRDRQHAVWIDLRGEGIGLTRDASEIWMPLWRALSNLKLPAEDVAEPRPSIRGRVEAYVDQLYGWLERHPDARLLVLLDEADRFLEVDARKGFPDTARIKSLMERTNRRFKVVFAGLHNVLRTAEQANHPLAHFGQPIEVGPLLRHGEWREATRLIEAPIAAAGYRFATNSMVDRILAQTNYYPSLIQLYCSKILKRLVSSAAGPKQSGPRYVVDEDLLDEVYRSQDLRDEIRAKFRLTLQLDPRYAVIAYAIALDSLGDKSINSSGLTVRDVQRKAVAWWAEGFERTSIQEFRTILEEMISLGVLRKIGEEGHVGLRNANLLLLMGTREEIEESLCQDRDLPGEYEPRVFHPPDQSNGNIEGFHPLTATQIAGLQRPKSGVTIIAGPYVSGVQRVPDSIVGNAANGGYDVCTLPLVTHAVDFQRALKDAISRGRSGTTVIVVPADSPWNERWTAAASAELGRLKSRDKHVRVVFTASPDALRSVDFGRLDGVPTLDWEVLRPYEDGFARHWFQDKGLDAEPDARRRRFEETGMWPELLAERCLARDPIGTPIDIGRFAGDWPELRKVIGTLKQYDGPANADDLAVLAELEAPSCLDVLCAGDRLGLLAREARDQWALSRNLEAVLRQGNDGSA